jgi:heptosyltransferase I
MLSAIGDSVHVLPIIASLRDAWPGVRITWVIQPTAHALMAGRPDVDDFIVFRRSRGARGFLDFRRAVRDRRFDLVIDLQVYFKAGLLTALLSSDRKLGFDRARSRDANWMFTTERILPHAPQHVQDQYLEFVEHLGVKPRRRWDFHFTSEELARRDAFLERLDRPALAVILRTSRPQKNWPAGRYARVLDVAEHDLGLQPVLVGSAAPAEVAVAEEVTRLTRARPVNALANDLRGLAALLGGCTLLLSPDTGPLHVAVALGVPTVGLYGYTDPKRSGPYRRFGDLTIDRYSRPGETTPSMEFRPGNMRRIEVEDVAERLELAVARYDVAGAVPT